MTKAQICIMISIVVYLFAMVMIGVVYSKKTKNVGDFYLGGRKLGPLVTAMSAEASDMSSYLLMGLPGLALASGLAEVGWTVIGLAVGTYLNWLIVAKKLRKYSARINAITIPDYFSQKQTYYGCCGIYDYCVLCALYRFGLCGLRQAFWHSFRHRLSYCNDCFGYCYCRLYFSRRF